MTSLRYLPIFLIISSWSNCEIYMFTCEFHKYLDPMYLKPNFSSQVCSFSILPYLNIVVWKAPQIILNSTLPITIYSQLIPPSFSLSVSQIHLFLFIFTVVAVCQNLFIWTITYNSLICIPASSFVPTYLYVLLITDTTIYLMWNLSKFLTTHIGQDFKLSGMPRRRAVPAPGRLLFSWNDWPSSN